MKIGIDIDGVVADFFKKFLEFYNKKTGNNILIENWVTYNFWDFLPITKEEGWELMNEFYLLDDFDEMPLIEGAKEAILQLSKENEVYIITARPLKWGEKTKRFFDKHFPGEKIKLIYCRDDKDKVIYKREICNNLGINILIEDYRDIALQCAEIGVRVILLDSLYNKNIRHENVIRAKNWNEILEKINELNNQEEDYHEIVEKVRQFVEEECKKPEAKYDYDLFLYHIKPVLRYAKELGEKRGADLEILELAALLHDIGSVLYGRENHHMTGCEIAEKKLRELNYPEDRIEKIKHCILSHRGSLNIKKESIEAEILAEADSMTHFDTIPGLFRACYYFEEKKSQGEACKSVLNKLINSYNKLSPAAKEIIKPKFEAAMLLFEENEQ